MPANRQHVDRDAKTAEILDVAESLLLGVGYESTTMAAVARGAGVSSNAVYWYFPSKDELLAAVLSRRQERAFARLDAGSDASLVDLVFAALAELDSVAGLTATVHERAERSRAVAEVHETFHARIGMQLEEGFREGGLPGDDARMAASAVMAIVEGIHLHGPTRDPVARNELVLWATQRFLSAQSP